MSGSVDLTNCDREPIHIPGTIQAHGGLLACSVSDTRILRRSANIAAMLDLSSDPLGKPLREVFDGQFVHDLLNALAKASEPRRPALMTAVPVGSGVFDIAVHSFAGNMIVEFERADQSKPQSALEIARALIAHTQLLTNRSAFNERVPRLVQAILGYDRVMLYEFAADGSGKVVGEAKRPHLESFKGQHFPAADIPKQARDLYIKNTIRVIADVKGTSSVIEPTLDESGTPLDLSFAHLRSVSPIHIEYLTNMGVGASMSISIIADGQLWGLLACHHYGAKALSMPQRTAAELYGEFLSLHLTSLHHRQRVEAHLRTRTALDKILAELTFHDELETFLAEALPKLEPLIACDGVGLWINGVWSAHGSTAPANRIPRIVKFAQDVENGAIFATHSLSDKLADAEEFACDAAGVLIIPLSQMPRDYLFFFRKEKTQTIEWGGDPNKTYTAGPLGDRLTPRKSFAVWKEIVQGQSDPWTEDDRITAEALRVGLREIIFRQSELLSLERKKAEVRQRVLNDELNHRVKNILALIKSLVKQPINEQATLESFVKGLTGRILALSNAHDQVVRSEGGGSLHHLLTAELTPYHASQIVIDGPEIGLNATAYSVLALVLHELATNAAKYGSLSVPRGRLHVTSVLHNDGSCAIHWKEAGGPVVSAPSRQGFGSVILERSIPFDLHGESDISYHPDGVEARIAIPAAFVIHRAAPPPVEKAVAAVADGVADLNGRKVLLLEDQLVIALDAEDMLRAMGVEQLVTVSTAHEALRNIAASVPDLAVLDVNLGQGTSLPVADELLRQMVPFVFATGYGDSVNIPQSFREVPIVRKPYTEETLREALVKAIAVRSRTP